MIELPGAYNSTRDKEIFDEALLKELEIRDVKCIVDKTAVEWDLQGRVLKIKFRPKPMEYYAAFRVDEGGGKEFFKKAAEHTAHQMEQRLHPERIEKMLLEAAMEVINKGKDD